MPAPPPPAPTLPAPTELRRVWCAATSRDFRRALSEGIALETALEKPATAALAESLAVTHPGVDARARFCSVDAAMEAATARSVDVPLSAAVAGAAAAAAAAATAAAGSAGLAAVATAAAATVAARRAVAAATPAAPRSTRGAAVASLLLLTLVFFFCCAAPWDRSSSPPRKCNVHPPCLHTSDLGILAWIWDGCGLLNATQCLARD